MPESLGHALLIANANYSDPTLNALQGTEVDIKVLEAVLADPAIGGYQVRTSIDESIHTLRNRIERFFVEAPKDGLLLLYLSGHGVKDRDGKLYFAAADTESNFLMSTGLAATFIQEASERSRCRRQVFIFDACFSGAFAKGYTHKSDQKVHAQEAFSGGTGKIIITASDDMQYAWVDDAIEGNAAASVFTRHLVEGLRTGAAANESETVTADHLYQYVYEHVLEDNRSQKPQLWSFGLNGDLILARNPAPKPIKLPAEIVELLEDPKSRVRLLGIDEMEKLLGQNSLHQAIFMALENLGDDDSKTVSARAAEVQAELEALRQEAELERQAEAKRLAEAEAKRQAEEERKRLAEAEAKLQAEEERKRLAEAEAKRQAEEERKRLAEAEAKRKAEEERKRLAEAEAKRQAEEERKRLTNAEAKRQAEEERIRLAEAEAKRKAEEERKRLAEAEAKRKAEEERKRLAEAEAKRQAEEECRRLAEEETPVEKKRRRWSRKAVIIVVTVMLVFFGIYQLNRQDQSPAHKSQEIAKLELAMLSIPAGEFWMGSKDSDKQASENEKPRHKVKVQAFKLGKTEVTQGQWLAVMGSNPSRFKGCGDGCPVESVSFDDVQNFIQKLKALTGKNYRLPTEAEWEYACRAGRDFTYCGGNELDVVAWYGGNSGKETHPVALKQANAWGLQDMSGNISEWTCSAYTADRYGNGSESTCETGDRRMIRGGSWYYEPVNLRSALRDGFSQNLILSSQDMRNDDLGFRLAEGQ